MIASVGYITKLTEKQRRKPSAWWVGFEPQTRRLKKTKTDVENRGAQTVWDLEKRLGTEDPQSGEETKKDGVFCHFSLLLADSFGGIIAHQFLLQQGQIH
jgi:hypothetical protein